MLSVMATAQEVLDVEMPANANPLQGTINVIGIISSPNNNNNNNINNNNISNNNHNNNNNSNDNGSIIPGDLTLSTAAEAEAAAGTAAGVGAGAGAVGAVSGAGAGAGAVGPVDHSFVAIPLLERRRRSRSHSRCHITPLAPIICIQQGGGHPEDLTQLSRSVSCFVRFRRSFAKFLGKIMGSNNPSEADRYDYYDFICQISRFLFTLFYFYFYFDFDFDLDLVFDFEFDFDFDFIDIARDIVSAPRIHLLFVSI
ncbi:GH12225 [Drosophila grimshawi]|uniref:GH12225 n=1 Tax=Drosophila grimshawi TaxID=7222 RepID=B4JJM1_DROGR|nr:GH12225 [Drosophila grimshawi]